MSFKPLNTELLPQYCMYCDEEYDDPVMLPCLHSCCRMCALDDSKCKTCGFLYNAGGQNGSSFPQNILLKTITAIHRAARIFEKHNRTIVCKDCCLVPISNASNICVNCEVFICNVDVTAHVKFGAGHHNFIPLTELTASSVTNMIPSEPYVGCANHPLVHVEQVCTQCDQSFCDDCSKLYHKDHLQLPVESFLDTQTSDIEAKVKNIKGKLTDTLYEELLEECQKLDEQKSQLVEAVNKDFDFLVEKINQRRNTLVYSIISHHDERVKLLQSVYERNEALMEKTKECLDIVNQYAVTYPRRYILPLALNMTNRLGDFNYQNNNMDLDIGKLEYNVKGLTELASEFELIGHVDPIRNPKPEEPICTYPKDLLKSGSTSSNNDSEEISIVASTVTLDNYLMVVFKTQNMQIYPPVDSEAAFKIAIIDQYSPTRDLCAPKNLNVKSVSNMLAHKNGCTYLVDRVGKQLLKLDQELNTVQVVDHRQHLQDPVCISYDKVNRQFLVYNMQTNDVNAFDMSLQYLSSFEINSPHVSRMTRSNSEIHRLTPTSPRPKSRTLSNAFFPVEPITPPVTGDEVNSINLSVNSKETVFYVPNSKQTLYVLEKNGNLLKEISLRDKIAEDELHSTLQKQTSLEKPPTNPYGTLGRGRKRSNSNPKKSEQPPSPKERTPNFTTFVCINTSDTIFIHQNNTLYIFTPELELVVRERIPETLNPKSMAVDFFGHIFYSTEDNIVLC